MNNMTTKACKSFRAEIDETSDSQALWPETAKHLSSCSACRTLAAEQHALRGLLANLDTVTAPSDFDFRLRARLARDEATVSDRFGWLSLISRPLGIAALVLLIAGAGIVVRNWLSKEGHSAVASNPQPKVEPVASPSDPKKVITPDPADQSSRLSFNQTKGPVAPPRTATPRRQYVARNNSNPTRKTSESATREFSGTPAPVVERASAASDNSPVLVPLNVRALKISVENGRGISRTISLPTVSFGSQRLMTRDSFAAPAAAPKGNW
jgi:hypothetical protein